MKKSNITNKNVFVLANILTYVSKYDEESHSELVLYGFEYEGAIYMIDWDFISEITCEMGADSKSFNPVVRIRAGKKQHKVMTEKATKICSVETFTEHQLKNGYVTKGQTFESLVWSFFGVDGYKPDNRDFRNNSDLEGLKAQIKFERGTFSLGADYDYSFINPISK